MSDLYYLKIRDKLLGTVRFPDFEFEWDPNCDRNVPFWLFKGEENPSGKTVRNFLKYNVAEEHNQGIVAIMGKYGCCTYSLWVLLQATLGITNDNPVWLVPEDKLHWKFEDYHVKHNPMLWVNLILDDGTVLPPIINDARFVDENEIKKELARRRALYDLKI